MTPIRVTFVLTHPIQYYAPWFRHITRAEPGLALTVIHAVDPTPVQQGAGFEQPFRWDVPLTDGYRSIIARPARSTDRIDTASFFGLDVKEIGGILAETAPHVVVVTGWYSVTLMRAIMAARRLGVPVLYRGDTNLLSGPDGWRRALWSVRSRLLLRFFDGALSPGVRSRAYLRRFGMPDYRIFDVPHGVDNAFFEETAKPFQSPQGRAVVRREMSIAADAFVPLFVGKLVPSKRPLDVVRACAKLGSELTLVMVGAGPLESAVRTEAQALGLDLRLKGFLNQRALGSAYAAADCLTLPSDGRETWGLVVNEGLATGLPAVVSDAVGCGPDLIQDGVTGFTFPLGDVDALAERLEQMRRSRGRGWASACRDRAKRHDVDAMTRGLTRACRSVLRHSVQPEPDGVHSSAHRVLACCGQMVLDGGLERMTFHAIRAAVASGAAVHCVVNSWENFRITPMAESAGATWSTGPYWYPLTRRRLTPLVVLRMLLEVLRVSAHTIGEAARIRPTHVFLPDFQTILRNAPALLWLRLRGARVVARLGNAPEPGSFNARLWRWAIAPFVDLFVCNSAFTERELLTHGVDAAKVRIIRNVPAPRRDPWLPDTERIPGRVVFVGQVIPEKGLDLLLDAVALLRMKRVDATLDVVGDMDGWEAPANAGYRASLRARAEQPDLAGAVRFLGQRDDVPRIMAAASVHCCPSLPKQREAFGNVVLEAKFSALPSVVTPSGELPSLVEHGQSGWVCRDASAEAVAEGLEFFLGSPVRLTAAADAARRSSEAFGQDTFERAWSEVFA